MSRRNEKRRRAREGAKSYARLFAGLAPPDQHAVNEKVIGAVIALTNADGHGPAGTKAFIEDRAKRLILDMQKVGLRVAGKRFRSAIAGHKKRARNWSKSVPNDRPPYPDKAPCHFGKKSPLISAPNFGVWAGLEPAHAPVVRA